MKAKKASDHREKIKFPPRTKQSELKVDKTNGPSTSEKAASEAKPAEEQRGERNFDTNQDEQSRITNSEQSGSIEEKENEGD
jgi:hypothetical protein